MTAGPVVIDRVTRTAPLGLRLWDMALVRSVTDGLVLSEPVSGRRARPTPGGVMAFHSIPGAPADPFGEGDGAYWTAAASAARPMTFEVSDARRRYLPFRFDADVPTRKLFEDVCAGAAAMPAVAAVPLLSAPGRATPAGLASVRADLRLEGGAPAAHAVLELWVEDQPKHIGVADADGRVVVFLAYPEPPAGAPVAPHAQTWQLNVAVRYAPSAATQPGPQGPPPDLCAVLSQAPATALASPGVAMPPQPLAFGQPLVLKSAGKSHVLVSTA